MDFARSVSRDAERDFSDISSACGFSHITSHAPSHGGSSLSSAPGLLTCACNVARRGRATQGARRAFLMDLSCRLRTKLPGAQGATIPSRASRLGFDPVDQRLCSALRNVQLRKWTSRDRMQVWVAY